MAGRPRLEPGQLGNVSIESAPGGVRARARIRDAGGNLRRISATAATEELAHESLRRQAASAALLPAESATDATIGELLSDWVARTRRYKRPQTARTYESTAVWLGAMCGAVSVHDFDLKRARVLLDRIRSERSPAGARQAKVALNGAFAQAIQRELIARNPLRDLVEEEAEDDAPTYLEVTQVNVLRRAILEREQRIRPHTGPAAGVLRWGVEVALGSGLRIGEVLALRHMDVDLASGVVEVRGTLIDDPDWKTVRQGKLKSRSQARRVTLPPFALSALVEAREVAEDQSPSAPAIQGRTGNWVSMRTSAARYETFASNLTSSPRSRQPTSRQKTSRHTFCDALPARSWRAHRASSTALATFLDTAR